MNPDALLKFMNNEKKYHEVNGKFIPKKNV